MAATGKDIERISGPDSMAMPVPGSTAAHGSMPDPAAAPKKKRHRAGKNRKKTRRQSFVAPSETDETPMEEEHRPSLRNVTNGRQSGQQQSSLYRIPQSNRSDTSLESQALLDHREHEISPNRRRSIQQSLGRPSMAYNRQQGRASQLSSSQNGGQRSRPLRAHSSAINEGDNDMEEATDRTPLLSRSHNQSRPELSRKNSAQGHAHGSHSHHGRRLSINSRASSQRAIDIGMHFSDKKTLEEQDYDVNNPPSVPSSPKIGTLDDVMVGDTPINPSGRSRDAIINIDYDEDDDRMLGSSPDEQRRRHTVADVAEMDVCYPHDGHFSDAGDDDADRQSHDSSIRRRRRKHRAHQWPVFDVLDEWTREEKEERTQQEHIRAKKISEPVMVDGRLRPKKPVWHRTEDDAPFRFTYFNETFDSTIHARTIGDLLQDGCTFPELFLPDPVEISESSESESECESQLEGTTNGRVNRAPASSLLGHPGEKRSPSASKSNTGTNTPSGQASAAPTPTVDQKAPVKRQGERPTFWLDVLKPTEMEMKVLAKAFGIHQLTIEDIQMDEPREKVELFKKYYFVNYRSFEQDKDSEDYMEPVNMYAVVFHDGVITFHHSMTPHPANVRRRIRQLNDYLSPNADWISYALIDDITDAYAPLVQAIEDEVDDIDDEILTMHEDTMHVAHQKEKTKAIKRASSRDQEKTKATSEKSESEKTPAESAGDMLRRVGECRKRVMGLYRLLGSKADVIKGFAKRCNEQWNVAPRSEIGLYLGDIQDHIVTMTGNLSHYESLLSRAHSNYLAQINVRMNERAEQTNDTLGKLTVLGTIVLPMNIITGMWGMNVWVPGQDAEHNLLWFWVITAGLFGFGLSCFFIAKRVYGIV